MPILLTGAFGFVGGHLLPALRTRLSDEPEIIAVGNSHLGLERSGVKSISMDITDENDVANVLRQFKPQKVIHLAALSSVQNAINAAQATYLTNVEGSVNLAKAMRKYVPGSTLIFASTAEIYGASFVSGEPVTEKTPVLPQNPYARSKLAAEISLQDMLSDICPVVALRLFNHTGPGQDERFVTAAFAAQIARIEHGLAEPTLKVGNLTAKRDFLDVADVIDAYLLAINLDHIGSGFSVYNIASSKPRSIASILESLRKMSSVPFSIEEDPARMRPSDIPCAIGNAAAFKEKTGWTPKRNFEQTLENILNAWRARYSQTNA